MRIAGFEELPRRAPSNPREERTRIRLEGGTLTVLQITAAHNMRGRILSLYGILLRGSPALGALVLGVAADRHGLTSSVVVGSTLSAPVCAWLLWRHRRGRADGSP